MISPQFIQSCQAGDERSIQNLVQTYQRGVFQLALSIIDSADEGASAPDEGGDAPAVLEAEKATRDTFIAAIDRLGRYREGSSFETWLFRIAIQVSQRRARRWRARRAVGRLLRRIGRSLTRGLPGSKAAQTQGALSTQAVAQADQASSEDTGRSPRLQSGDAELWISVRQLNEKLRVPVILRYYHDYPIAEIAHLLHISEGSVHARLDAAREKISLRLEK
jgi:RNA polymerase sigma-70 factor (ECF subfamily)